MGLAEFVEEPVGGEGLFVDGGAAGVAVFEQVAVLVPLEVADVVFTQKGVNAIVDVLPRRRVYEVDDVLLPPFEWQPAAVLVALDGRANNPFGVRTDDVGVEVDHFGFHPEAELHAAGGHGIDQRREAVGPE